MIKLDYHSRLPIYRQIKESIIELIMLGAFPADSQLPSVRSLAVELGINPNTIQKAYQELENENVIYTIAGRGSFVRGRSFAGAQMREKIFSSLSGLLKEAKTADIGIDEIISIVQQEYSEVKKND